MSEAAGKSATICSFVNMIAFLSCDSRSRRACFETSRISGYSAIQHIHHD